MKIISADVSWKGSRKRNAVAIATPPRQIEFLAKGLGDDELKGIVCKWVEPESLILLDVPLEGCENLEEPRRTIEKVLQPYIPLYPASMAGMRGLELKRALLEGLPYNIVETLNFQEIYPHAIYKFLWMAKQNSKLEDLKSGEWKAVLNSNFRRINPPRYKGKVQRSQRLYGLNKLYNLLTRWLMLEFREKLSFPDEGLKTSQLELLSDEYDACLGVVAGLWYTNRNPYACIAGFRDEGEILLFIDRWLRKELETGGLSFK